MPHCTALIVAAGRGRRFGGPLPKQYALLEGQPVLRHALLAFRSCPGINGLPGIISPGMIDLHNHVAYNFLPLWNSGKRFQNRYQWARIDEYDTAVKNPYNAVALQALENGSAPVTTIYDAAFNEHNSPWMQMFSQAVYKNDIDGALKTGQDGFERVLRQAGG